MKLIITRVHNMEYVKKDGKYELIGVDNWNLI